MDAYRESLGLVHLMNTTYNFRDFWPSYEGTKSLASYRTSESKKRNIFFADNWSVLLYIII